MPASPGAAACLCTNLRRSDNLGHSRPWAPRSHRLAAGGTSLDEALIRVHRQPGAAGPSTARGDTAEAFPAGGDRYQLQLVHELHSASADGCAVVCGELRFRGGHGHSEVDAATRRGPLYVRCAHGGPGAWLRPGSPSAMRHCGTLPRCAPPRASLCMSEGSPLCAVPFRLGHPSPGVAGCSRG